MSYSLKGSVASRLRELIACDDDGTLTSWVIGGAFAKGSECTQNLDSNWTRTGGGSNFATKVFETTEVSDNGGCTWTTGNGPQCLTTGGNYTTIVHVFDRVDEGGGGGGFKTGYTGESESGISCYNIRLYMGGGGAISPYFGTSYSGVNFSATYSTPSAGATIALGIKSDAHAYGYYGAEGSTLSEEDLGTGFDNAAWNGRYLRFGVHSGFADPDYRMYARHILFAVFNDQPVLADIQSIHNDPITFFFDVAVPSEPIITSVMPIYVWE